MAKKVGAGRGRKPDEEIRTPMQWSDMPVAWVLQRPSFRPGSHCRMGWERINVATQRPILIHSSPIIVALSKRVTSMKPYGMVIGRLCR